MKVTYSGVIGPKPSPKKQKEAKAWRQVDKSEFDEFAATYPRKLTRDVARFVEPPVLTLNDFSDGKVWPESVIAKVVLHSSMGQGQPDDYYLLATPPGDAYN